MPKHKVPAHEDKSGNTWQRLSVGERITMILTAIGVIAALLVVPEVRYFLHLEKRPSEEAQKPAVQPDTRAPSRQTQQTPEPAKTAPKLKLVPLPNAPEPEDNRRLITENPIPKTLNGKTTTWESATLVTVPETVSDKLLVKAVAPEYPSDARLKGKVVLKLRIGTDGEVEKVEVVSGHPLLTSSAVSAAEQWQYTPYLYKGRAIPMDTTVTMQFGSDNHLIRVPKDSIPDHALSHEVNGEPPKQPD